jgi:hypothetical protein
MVNMLPQNVIERLNIEVKRLPNVVGYSKTLKRKIVKGRETDIMAIRIYVEKKIPEATLKPAHIIPKKIEDIPTDVVEVGKLQAPPSGQLKAKKKRRKAVDKTQKFRPVILGVSIGNYAITAGTNGMLYTDKKGDTLFGSNAHVFVDDVSKKPEEVSEKRVLQPGPYDIKGQGGNVDDPDYVVAEYVWHQQIFPVGSVSGCPLASALASLYNALAKLARAKTRLKPTVETVNHIDFAVAKPLVDYELKFPDFNIEGYKLVGHGFAGSDQTSVVCKIKYIMEKGYTPKTETAEPKVGDILEKSGRTSCYTKAKVIDESAQVQVSYDTFTATFDNVILTEKLLDPGDSGSSVWHKP